MWTEYREVADVILETPHVAAVREMFAVGGDAICSAEDSKQEEEVEHGGEDSGEWCEHGGSSKRSVTQAVFSASNLESKTNPSKEAE